jgi:hypothetical protein
MKYPANFSLNFALSLLSDCGAILCHGCQYIVVCHLLSVLSLLLPTNLLSFGQSTYTCQFDIGVVEACSSLKTSGMRAVLGMHPDCWCVHSRHSLIPFFLLIHIPGSFRFPVLRSQDVEPSWSPVPELSHHTFNVGSAMQSCSLCQD